MFCMHFSVIFRVLWPDARSPRAAQVTEQDEQDPLDLVFQRKLLELYAMQAAGLRCAEEKLDVESHMDLRDGKAHPVQYLEVSGAGTVPAGVAVIGNFSLSGSRVSATSGGLWGMEGLK